MTTNSPPRPSLLAVARGLLGPLAFGAVGAENTSLQGQPLPFDGDNRPKPAWDAFLAGAKKASGR